MRTIVCDAIPFCYGPATALLNLGHALVRRGFTLRAAATGTTAELLASDGSFEIHSCAGDLPSRIAATRALLNGADVYLNVVDPDLYAAVEDHPVPKVYVDFLFWMFSPTFARAEVGAELYLVENYPGVRDRLATFGDRIKRPHLIPPLISAVPSPGTTDRSRLLVCFGGLESPLTRVGLDTRYPYLMTSILQEATMGLDFSEILVTGNRQTMADLAQIHRGSRIKFEHLPHSAFLRELSQATVLLTHPGLYAPFEGFASGVPTLFLPSSNYTQILQLRFYRAAGTAPWSADWEDIGLVPESGPIPAGLPEGEGVRRVLECVRRFEHHFYAQRALVQQLQVGLKECLLDPKPLVVAQRRFVETYIWTNGPEVAADAISRLL